MGGRALNCPYCGQNYTVASGKVLRRAREQAGLTLRAFAAWAVKSPTYIHDVETGRRRVTPRILHLYRRKFSGAIDA